MEMHRHCARLRGGLTGMDQGRQIMDEDGIIQSYFAPLTAGVAGAFNLMDDAATLTCPPGQELVVTTDTLIAGVHFLPDDAPSDIAAKALGVNLSDLAAKGADPSVYTLSLALPADVSPDWLESFAAVSPRCRPHTALP